MGILKKGFTLTPKKLGVTCRRQGGFTLVELLVVVAIIGMLTTMVVISIQQVKAKARDAQRVADINSLATALTLYHNDFESYPIYDGYIETSVDPGNTLYDGLVVNSKAIRALPVDPLNVENYRYYYQSTDGKDYYLEYYLETNSVSGKSKGRNYFIP